MLSVASKARLWKDVKMDECQMAAGYYPSALPTSLKIITCSSINNFLHVAVH
jgi:hypothetical protein